MRSMPIGAEPVKGGDAERRRKIAVAHPARQRCVLQREAHLSGAGPGVLEERRDARGLAVSWPVDVAGHGNRAVRVVRPPLHYALHDLRSIDSGRYAEVDTGARFGGHHIGSAAALHCANYDRDAGVVVGHSLEVEDLSRELTDGAAAILRA